MMKPTVKVMNADKVIKSMEQIIDLTNNFVPFFIEVLGKQEDRRPWTLRGSVLKNFSSKKNPEGFSWKPLTRKYAKYKSKRFPGKPLMVRTGQLFNSLVRSNSGSVVTMTKTKLVYGTSVEYAKYNAKKRAFLGVSEKQKKALKRVLKAYVQGAKQSKKEALAAIRNNINVT